jgi:hypothetical protein
LTPLIGLTPITSRPRPSTSGVRPVAQIGVSKFSSVPSSVELE